jgi:RimJ/RimL family protein N-acetyltransferase
MSDIVPDLPGKLVTLRRPQPRDVAARLAIGWHREIIEAYGGDFDPEQPFTRDHAERAIAAIEKERFAWVIDVGGFIGQIRFHSFAPQDRRAALALGIEAPQFLGKGYGTEAIRLALGYMFACGLHRVSVRVLAHNRRAINSYRKCGFVEEGRERDSALIGGVWQDDLIMGVLAHEVQ